MTITSNQIVATQLYISAYGRNPDAAGLAYWSGLLDSGTSVADVAKAFSNSTEFHSIYDGKSPSQVVTMMYQNEFGRAPDAAGLAFYTNGGLNASGLLASLTSPTNTEGLIHNAQTLSKIDQALSSGTSFPTGVVDNSPTIITQTVQTTVTKEVPGATVFVNVPTPTEPTHVVTTSINATPDASSLKVGTTDFITGAGIPATHSSVVLDKTSGVELTLSAGYRTGDMVTPTTGADGFAHFTIAAGSQDGTHNEQGSRADRSHAGITYSVNAGVANTSDHTFQLWIDRDPTAGTDYLKMAPDVLQPDFNGTTHVHQNTFNMGFLPDQNGIHYANLPVGTYDVQLVELVGSAVVAANHIVLNIV
jgi:hypothetical protein